MNIECDQETLAELEHGFKFNDAVIRHITFSTKTAKTDASPMMKEEKSKSAMGGDTAKTAPKAAEPAKEAAPAKAEAAAE